MTNKTVTVPVEAIESAWYACGLDIRGGDISKFISAAIAASQQQAQAGEAEAIALWELEEDGWDTIDGCADILTSLPRGTRLYYLPAGNVAIQPQPQAVDRMCTVSSCGRFLGPKHDECLCSLSAQPAPVAAEQLVKWTEAAALTVLTMDSDGPFGESDTRDTVKFLMNAEIVRANIVAAHPIASSRDEQERDAVIEMCAKICDEMGEHYAAYKDTALLNGDVALSNAASGEPRAAEFLAKAIRALKTAKAGEQAPKPDLVHLLKRARNHIVEWWRPDGELPPARSPELVEDIDEALKIAATYPQCKSLRPPCKEDCPCYFEGKAQAEAQSKESALQSAQAVSDKNGGE